VSTGTRERLTTGDASQAWDELSRCVDTFIEAWEQGGPEPGTTQPDIAQFLPSDPPALRRFVLIELVKVDLEYRWQDRRAPKTLEAYLQEFPELAEHSGLPCDLVYEEFHIRRGAGDEVDCEEYCRRYPAQARELRQLLGLESPHASTILLGRTGKQDIEVGEKLEDFELLARIGQGAFASVYLARQVSMQRLVALKVSSDRGSEPQTMAQLDHPHIVRVYDQRILADRKLRLLYMQHIPGGTLESAIAHMREVLPQERRGRTLLEAIDQALVRRGESPPTESTVRDRLATCSWCDAICWLGSRLAAALDYAHERGVLHRDIKPANVLLAGDGSPKLADFNISFSSKLDGVTPAAYFGGSLAYMSPEQLEACNPSHERSADELDGRSDIYSLGVVLWELVVGRRPFDDPPIDGNWYATLDEMTAIRRAGITAKARESLPADCPRGLAETLEKCLAFNPDDRYASGRQLAKQLELCLQPRTQRLLRPPQGGLRRLAQRRPFWVMLAAGLIPNVLLSVLNIAYNYDEIIRFLSAPAQRLFSQVQLVAVNGVAYGSAIALLLILAWPILGAVQRVRRGEQVDAKCCARERTRTLRYGDWVSVVTGGEWLITAIVFPAWLHAQEEGQSTVALSHYLHFLGSQALCGLIAATLTFFLVTFVMVRMVYPVLVRMDLPEHGEIGELRKLARRTWIYFALAVAAPFLAVIVLVLIETNLRAAFFVLGAMGLVGFIVSFFLALVIRDDLESLAVAVAPPGQVLSAASSDSFWTMSG